MHRTDELRALLTGYRLSAALAVAADLGLSDLLVDGPLGVDDLAQATSTDPGTLHRLLRALATVGVYAEQPDGRYALAPLGDGLRSDVPGTLRPLARTFTDPAVWGAWGHLGHSVRTGENAFEALHGTDVWTHRREHPEHNEVFNANMAALTSIVAGAVAEAYDFSDRRQVVDVGGGRGVLLAAVLDRYPGPAGVVMDLPHAVGHEPPDGASRSVAERWSAVSGSFFDDVPAADCYLLKAILHDWPDAECVSVLRTCRRSLADDGVVLVVEAVLGRPGYEGDVAFSDLNMLVLPGGRERTEDEFAALLEAADLRLTDVRHTASRLSVLEARAA